MSVLSLPKTPRPVHRGRMRAEFVPLADWLRRHRVKPEAFEALEVVDRTIYGIRKPTGREIVFDGIPAEADRLVKLAALPDGMDVLTIPPTFDGIPCGQFVAPVAMVNEAEIILTYAGRQLRLLAALVDPEVKPIDLDPRGKGVG